MEINNTILEKRISDYHTIIKNPREWKLFKNFVIIQWDIKIRQAKIISKRISTPIIENFENKFCFCMYVIFAFPELTEKIRRSFKLKADIEKIAVGMSSLGSLQQLEDSKISINSSLAQLFDSSKEYVEFVNSADNSKKSFLLTPAKEDFISFMERFHMDRPLGTEWEFLMTNDILTLSNLVSIEQAYGRESNIRNAYVIQFNKNWNHFFQSLEEYVRYAIENKYSPYIFVSMFINCSHQFKEIDEVVEEYQEHALISLSRLVQIDPFLENFVEQIISHTYMATDIGTFARYKAKLFELGKFQVRKRTSFSDLFNYLVKRNFRLMDGSIDNKLFSLLVSTCQFNNSLLKIFHIPTSVEEYLDDRRVKKSESRINSVGIFRAEDPNNIAVFGARVVELKYWISVVKQKEPDYQEKAHLEKLQGEKLLLKNYIFPERTQSDYVSMKKSTVGNLIEGCLKYLMGERKVIYSNPVLEALETLALMIFFKENQESKEKPGEKNDVGFLVSKINFPRLVVELINEKNDFILREEYIRKTSPLVFLGKDQDEFLKEIITMQKRKSNSRRKYFEDPNETILKACSYLFESIDTKKNKKEGYFAIGERNNSKTKIFIEKVVSKSSIKSFRKKYGEIFSKNKDKYQILLIILGDDSARGFAEEVKKMRKAGSERGIFVNIEFLKE